MLRKPRLVGGLDLPSAPSPSPEEVAAALRIAQQLEDAVAMLRQRNLYTAVLLAQQAVRGRGPLMYHFTELGRRYVNVLNEPSKPKLRLVSRDER